MAQEDAALLGAGIAIGTGAGVALFAATENPAFIAIGTGVGVALGAALSRRRSR